MVADDFITRNVLGHILQLLQISDCTILISHVQDVKLKGTLDSFHYEEQKFRMYNLIQMYVYKKLVL